MCIMHFTSHGDVLGFDFMRSCSACLLTAVLCHHMVLSFSYPECLNVVSFAFTNLDNALCGFNCSIYPSSCAFNTFET